jgi:hypothetical protein
MDVDAIVQALGGPTQFGDAIGVSRTHAAAMKTRNSIPPEYWPAVIKAAASRGIPDITPETLMKIAADNAARRRAPASQPVEAAE